MLLLYEEPTFDLFKEIYITGLKRKIKMKTLLEITINNYLKQKDIFWLRFGSTLCNKNEIDCLF